ncbi:MAG: hypothetical protein IJI59_12590, partial [Clostridia bacterium]|nr:hypothetical protein [Clostridia bacterium]
MAVLGGHRAVLGPEEALDLSDTVGNHAFFHNMPLVCAHPARCIVGGVLSGLGIQQGLGRLVTDRTIPVLPSGSQRPLGEFHLLEIIVVCHEESPFKNTGARDQPRSTGLRGYQFQLTVPVPVVTISPLA